MKATLVKKIEEAKDTKSFFFKTETPITFNPGQYVYLTLPELKYKDERGATRHFTLSNSPSEGDITRLTTRIRKESGYKMTLDELSIGSECELRGPQGHFILDKEDKKTTRHIFIAGGIGITPFRSMIKYDIDNRLKTAMSLIYSNSDMDFVFKKELDIWKEGNKNIDIKYHVSKTEGRINTQILKRMLPDDIKTSILYVVGPNPFVNAIEDMLIELDINQDNIRSEKFTGY